RALTCCKVHADKMMHNPVDIEPFLESSCGLGIHVGASAIGRTPSSQRCMEGFQMIGMHLCGGKRLCGVGMLWIRGWVLRPFGTALMPLRPFALEPHFEQLQRNLSRKDLSLSRLNHGQPGAQTDPEVMQ